MLGCGAHVRIIALPHVRCACGSACGKDLELCVRKCVRMSIFWTCDVRSHFFTCLLTFSKMIESKVCTLLSKMYLLLLSLTINQSFGPARATDQHFGRLSSYIVPSSFGRKAVGNIKKKKVLHTSQQCHTMG